MNISWGDGTIGYDPRNLEIERFGLDYEFIIANKLTWIDNLITASGGYIAEMVNGKIVQGKTKKGKPHPNFHLPYAQDYLKKYGVRKCEANALVVNPAEAMRMCRRTIEKYLVGAKERFQERRNEVVKIVEEFREKTGLDKAIEKAISLIERETE